MSEETRLFVAEKDKALAWLDVDDVSLGRFARWFIIKANKSNIEQAEAKDMPMMSLMAMHGGIALCRMAHEANADTLTTDFKGATSASGQMGDWKVTVKRIKRPSRDTRRMAETGTGSGRSPSGAKSSENQ